ncbi:MAG: BlaI/MecI/CopY family transcriptional regulator [Methylacidiphilales bacterium]|nr:BlaI/MecI/CopY family transcriptional regulator [Candidatus Methylacidiphilales bacterium]
MPQNPNISEAEWEVMEILWRRSPLTALEVVQELAPHKHWKDQTIRTMLGRLVRKKALTFRADGKIYFYRPLVTREHCVRVESRSFLDRVFGGAAKPLLAQMVQEARLSREEIAELKRLLTEKEKK